MTSIACSKKSSKLPTNADGHVPPSAALRAVGARPWKAQRRPTKQASYELCNHAKAYLEGGQYTSGYDFLYSLLTAGTSISKPETPYIGFLAPPAYIAFASSLMVYPKLTTRTHSRDAKKGADAALRYLRCIHTTIDGPAYPAIRRAFFFPKEQGRRRAPGHRSAAASRSPELGGDIDSIAGDAANAQSLWTRAEDFWHIVGWAFNCSTAHRKRWNRWQLWLSVMVDFLEKDWDFCEDRYKDDEPEQQALLQETLLWHYIVGHHGSANRGARRRIVKAIFATATPESLRDYPEIWEKETIGPKCEKNKKQQLVDIDFENGNTGDYDSDEQIQSSPDDADRSGVSSTTNDGVIRNPEDAAKAMGGMDAVELRQRLIALLAKVATALQSHFTTVSDLFDTILEDFNQFPIMVFKLLLCTSKMPRSYQISFGTNLVLPVVSSKLPDHFNYKPIQASMETMLLPIRAVTQSYATNAKISLILEQIMIYMMEENDLTPNDTLRQAVQAGIEARHSVYGTGRGKKSTAGEEEQAKTVMHACSDRISCLLEILEMAAGKAPHLLKARQRRATLTSSFMSGSSLSSPPDSDLEAQG